MWAVTEAVVSPVVGYQILVIPALFQILGLSVLTIVCPLSLNTSRHNHIAAAGSGSEWVCPLQKLVSEGPLMELHCPSQLSRFNRLISWRKLPKLLLGCC